MTARVAVSIDKQVATVSLNRPEKYNGLDMAMFTEITAVAKRLRKDRSVRAVIIRGEGKAFCSGLDIKAVSASPLNFARLLIKPGRKIANLAQDVGYIWRDLPVPVIAVCHGYCFGGGFQLALGADFRFTTADCEFSIMETRLGLIPDMSLAVTLRELTTIDVAKELTMTGRRFTGTEAKALGLVTRVCDDPLVEAQAFAETLKTRSPDAIAASKLLFNRTWTATDRVALDWETRLQKKIIGRYNQRAAISQSERKAENKPYRDRRDF